VNALVGLTVVVTRPSAQATALNTAIADEGGSVVALPMIETRPTQSARSELAAAVTELAADDWLLVMSPTGAAVVLDVLGEQSCRTAAVGPATAEALGAAGWTIDLVPTHSSGAGLAAELPEQSRAVIGQARWGRPELRQALEARGWQVTAVGLYQTVNTTPSPDEVQAALAGDVVVFASPSAVRNYTTKVGGVPADAVCIGKTTANEAITAGFTTRFAERFDHWSEVVHDTGIKRHVADAPFVTP